MGTNSLEVAGTYPRDENFRGDDNVVGSAEQWDYSYSGYDRGHMAPAGDMKWSKKAMDESFFMTNMCPQAKTLNTGAWKRLEENAVNGPKSIVQSLSCVDRFSPTLLKNLSATHA